MSTVLLTAIRPLQMSAAAKAVLWVLADAAHHPSDQEMPCGCWLLNETIATRACISVAKVKRGLAELRTRKLILSQLTGRGSNFWVTASYQVAHHEPSDSSLCAPESSGSVYQTSEAAAVAHCEPPSAAGARNELPDAPATGSAAPEGGEAVAGGFAPAPAALDRASTPIRGAPEAAASAGSDQPFAQEPPEELPGAKRQRTAAHARGPGRLVPELPEAIRVAHAIEVMRADPATGVGDAARIFRVSVAAIEAAIGAQSETQSEGRILAPAGAPNAVPVAGAIEAPVGAHIGAGIVAPIAVDCGGNSAHGGAL